MAIKDKLTTLFLKDPSKRWFWLALSLFFKGLPFFILLHNRPLCNIPGFWGGTMGDTPSYLNPINNLLAHGIYSPDFRMPGYGFVYMIFHLFSTEATACNLVIITQFILAAISVYCLALAAKMFFKSDKAFYLCFYLFLISTYSNFYDAYLLTESFCTSALVFSIYFFVLYFDKKQSTHLIFSGLFMTWAIFLRPIFAPVLLLFAFVLFLQLVKERIAWKKPLLLFLLPFLLIDGSWVVRNYVYHNRIIPLTATVLYPEAANSYVEPLFKFVQSWGASTNYADNHSALSWFDFYIPGVTRPDRHDTIPSYIYTSAFNRDSLLRLKHLIDTLQSKHLDSNTAKIYQAKLITKLNTYRLSIAKEKPFLYYIKTPIKLTKTFLYGPETREYLKRGQVFGKLGKLIIVFYTVFYLGVLLLGFAGMVLFLRKAFKHKYYISLIFSIVPIYIIVIHPIVFRYAVNRFLMPSWPFWLICATFTLLATYNAVSKRDSASLY